MKLIKVIAVLVLLLSTFVVAQSTLDGLSKLTVDENIRQDSIYEMAHFYKEVAELAKNYRITRELYASDITNVEWELSMGADLNSIIPGDQIININLFNVNEYRKNYYINFRVVNSVGNGAWLRDTNILYRKSGENEKERRDLLDIQFDDLKQYGDVTDVILYVFIEPEPLLNDKSKFKPFRAERLVGLNKEEQIGGIDKIPVISDSTALTIYKSVRDANQKSGVVCPEMTKQSVLADWAEFHSGDKSYEGVSYANKLNDVISNLGADRNRYNLMVALMAQETSFRENAISSAGAVGLGQFIYPTANSGIYKKIFENRLTDCGCGYKKNKQCNNVPREKIKCTPLNDNRFNPLMSIEASATYIDRLYSQTDCVSLDYVKEAFSVAGYNSGPVCPKFLKKDIKNPTLNDLRVLPDETKCYVERIYARKAIFDGEELPNVEIDKKIGFNFKFKQMVRVNNYNLILNTKAVIVEWNGNNWKYNELLDLTDYDLGEGLSKAASECMDSKIINKDLCKKVVFNCDDKLLSNNIFNEGSLNLDSDIKEKDLLNWMADVSQKCIGKDVQVKVQKDVVLADKAISGLLGECGPGQNKIKVAAIGTSTTVAGKSNYGYLTKLKKLCPNIDLIFEPANEGASIDYISQRVTEAISRKPDIIIVQGAGLNDGINKLSIIKQTTEKIISEIKQQDIGLIYIGNQPYVVSLESMKEINNLLNDKESLGQIDLFIDLFKMLDKNADGIDEEWANNNENPPLHINAAAHTIIAKEIAKKGFGYGDLDLDGYFSSVDCNDHDPSIYPGSGC